MKKMLNSKWKFIGYAFLIAIGGIIGATIVDPGNMYSIYGVLTGSLIIVVINSCLGGLLCWENLD